MDIIRDNPWSYQRISANQRTDKSAVSAAISSTKAERKIARKRTVTLYNAIRSTVKVSFKCGDKTTTIEVLPRDQTSVRIPLKSCEVRCTGKGKPSCPRRFRAEAVFFKIR